MSKLPLRTYRPLSPGIRWKKSLMLIKRLPKLADAFRIARKWHAGRNIAGRVAFSVFKKKKYTKKITIQATKLDFYDISLSRSYHFTFEKNKPKTYFVTRNGGSFVLPATVSNLPGRLYYSLDLATPTFLRYFSGLPIEIHLLAFYARVSNVATTPFYKFQFATSSGTFCTKIRANKREKNIKLILPSKQYKFFTPNTLAIIGRNIQYWLYKLNFGKAGTRSNQGYKPSVRGIAMNSVDHPHGGKANSVQPEVSPWGWVTKKSH